MTVTAPEAWLRGPLPGVEPLLMPAAHALVQAREDIERVTAGASADDLWQRPGGAASAGYHLQHVAGSLDRLLTYARGERLNEAQRAALVEEGTSGAPASALAAAAQEAIDRALAQLRSTPREALLNHRAVGRAQLPATVIGLLFHAAEHTTRHVGQLITTLKIVRGAVGVYTIRLAEPADVDRLPTVERRAARAFESWLSETGLTPAFLNNASSFEELDAARQRGHLWVAVGPDEDVVGFAQVVILDQLAHLDELDVVPEHARRGVGSRLVDAVCRWAKAAGFLKVTLSTFRAVPWNQPFYEKLGFRVVDAGHLPPQHVELVAHEKARGLRTDLRVIMEYRLE